MNNATPIHPDSVFEAILSTTSHPVKRRNLVLIHQVCKERHQLGSRDFSLKVVGETAEARGGPKLKTLWNAQSSDYRKLVEAWQSYVGHGPTLRESQKVRAEDTLTRSIADPATRIIVEKLLRERNALRAEVNILKAHASVTIDRRPQVSSKASYATANGGMEVEVHTGPELNQPEREALEHAISRDLWDAEGWTEENLGRVVTRYPGNDRSRTIFKPGFVSAIRKILAGR